MKDLTVENIIEQTKGELVIGDKSIICKSFSKDTRTINKGDCYIGIKGENFDGSKFWMQALDNGADVVIVEKVEISEKDKEKYKDKTIIKVENTLEALYKIASYKRSLYDIPVIAITGSVGKTSTKDMIASVVSKKYKTLKTIGNNNNNIGMPLTILRLQDEEAIVLEMGMDHFGEISLLSNIAKPNICVITNIGTSHILNLGSQENILKAKLEILEGAENPTIIINHDDEFLCKWYEQNKNTRNIKTYGINTKSDVMAKDIKLMPQCSEFTSVCKNKESVIKVPVGGEHYILNSLCAITVGNVLEIDKDKIADGIEHFELTKQRMDITDTKSGVKVINDAYNANCESMQASLKILGAYKDNRKIAVLGDMLNLGDFSKELHEKVGKAVVENKVDILICQGKEAQNIAKEAGARGLQEIYQLENIEEVLEKLRKISKCGDVVLIKASHAMKFYEVAERFIEIEKD